MLRQGNSTTQSVTRTGPATAAARSTRTPVDLPSAGRNAAIVGAAFVASRILGLVREVILGYRFGTSSEYDAYVSAFRVPDLLFLVVMSGAFGAAFIPIFGGYLENNDPKRAWRLASAVVTRAAVAI